MKKKRLANIVMVLLIVVIVQLIQIVVKFGPEGCVFDVVDGALEAVFAVYGHASAPGSQMGVVVDTKEKIHGTAALRCYAKYTAHKHSPFISKYL